MSKHLSDNSLAFNAAEFQQKLSTKFMGRCFIYRTSTTSTMSVAEREIQEGGPSGTLILAECQTQGVGRAGRTWISELKGNLYFSFILRVSTIETMININMATAVAIAYALKSTTKLENVGVKWPNDIWIKNKKIAGVLVNTSIIGQEFTAIIGIGLNVMEDIIKNNNEDVRNTATSVFNELGGTKEVISREAILAAFCNHFEVLLNSNFNEIMTHYKKLDILVGKDVIVMPKKKENKESYEYGKAIGFDESGYLIVQCNNSTKTLLAEEVSIRPTAE